MVVNEYHELIINPDEQRRAYSMGRQYVKAATGSTRNACVATATAYLTNAGLLPKQLLNTRQLMVALGRWTRIDNASDVQRGDVVFSQDNNHNGTPDHVVIALSDCTDGVSVECVDNQNAGNPYHRNLVNGCKTPMWFALRTDDVTLSVNDRAVAVQAFKMLYNLPLPNKTMKVLNELRKHRIFNDIHAD